MGPLQAVRLALAPSAMRRCPLDACIWDPPLGAQAACTMQASRTNERLRRGVKDAFPRGGTWASDVASIQRCELLPVEICRLPRVESLRASRFLRRDGKVAMPKVCALQLGAVAPPLYVHTEKNVQTTWRMLESGTKGGTLSEDQDEKLVASDCGRHARDISCCPRSGRSWRPRFWVLELSLHIALFLELHLALH